MRWITDLDARLFGPGTYGLDGHIPVEVRQDKVVEFVDDLIRAENTERQWHVWEIYEVMLAERPDLSMGVDPYVLNMLMRRLPADCYEYRGRFVWTFKGRGLDDAQRIDIADAFVAALLEAKRPLTNEELRDAVSKSRGLHPHLMILPSDRMIRVAPGVWGLKERDIGLTDEELRILLDQLAELLTQRQREIHVSEIVDLLIGAKLALGASVTGYLLCNLAISDPRFHWNRGQLLGLSEWGPTRRLTLSQAVREVSSSIVRPTPFEEIWNRVCDRAERKIPKMNLSTQLQGLGNLRFDDQIGMWVPTIGARNESSSDDVKTEMSGDFDPIPYRSAPSRHS